MTSEPLSPKSQSPTEVSAQIDALVSAARAAFEAVRAASEAADGDSRTPQPVRELMSVAEKASRVALEATESWSSLPPQRQSFADFTTLLGEEVQEEVTKYAERTIRKAKSLVEDHFQIDEAFRMLGPLRQDSNRARDVHDLFNLIFLIPVVVLNAMNWSCLSFRCAFVEQRLSVTELWHGEAFMVFWWTTLAYFIVDVAFVTVLPQCVKSPKVIMQHHLATIGYICVPYTRPEYGWLMGACMIVEVNTWFLIARRHFNRNGDRPFMPGVPLRKSLTLVCVSTCFYISWFVIRLMFYPLLLIVILREYYKETVRVGSPLNIVAITPVMQCVFIFLNVKWTVDLVRSKLKGRGASKGL